MKLAEVNLLQIQQPLTSPRRAEAKSDADFGKLVETAVRQSQRQTARAESRSGDGDKTESVKAEPAAVDAEPGAPVDQTIDEDLDAVEASVVKKKQTLEADQASRSNENDSKGSQASEAAPVAGAAVAVVKATADVEAKNDRDAAAAIKAAAEKAPAPQKPVQVKPEAVKVVAPDQAKASQAEADSTIQARPDTPSGKPSTEPLTLATWRVAKTLDAPPSPSPQPLKVSSNDSTEAAAAKIAQQAKAQLEAAGQQAAEDHAGAESRPQAQSPAPVKAEPVQVDADAPKVQHVQQAGPQSPSGQAAAGATGANVQLDAAQVTVEATSTTASHTTSTTAASATPQSAIPLPDDLAGDDAQRLTEQSVRALRSVVNQRGGSVTLRLSPPELGALRVQVQLNNGVVRAQIDAGNTAVRSLLQQQLSTLRTALESHGLTVQHLEVNAPLTTHAGHHANLQQDHADDGRSRGQFQQQGSGGSGAGGSGAGDQPGDQSQGQGLPQSRFERELLDLVV